MIRKATLNDINEINKLGIQFSNNFLNTYNMRQYICNDLYYCLVSEDDKINSFMLIYKNIDYYELEAIVVDKNARRRNIASNIFNYFINNYTNDNDVILLEVAVNNVAAVNMYKKYNFEIIGVRKKYYDGIDAYIMKKVI